VRKLSLDAARRIAVRATRLDAPRPKSILDVVRQAGALQLDPTSAVARSELLVLWSRLGRYAVRELDRLLWEERALFTWRAFLYPVEDWPLVAASGSTFPGDGRIAAWLRDNAPFERYVLAKLTREGPTPQSRLEDRSVRAWESTGWTHGKNVSQLLEFLWAQGKVLVTARRGQERVWDLAGRVVPPTPPLSPEDAALVHLEQRFRQLGPMTEAGSRRVPLLRGLPLADAFACLVRDGVLVACAIDGLPGTWYVHRDLLEPARPFRGRTTLLSPFDPLVYDRTRAQELWSFRYKLEIYVPVAKREFGYFVLPILHRDRLVGRIDPLFDRKAGVLRVKQVYAEETATEDAGPAIAKAMRELARWLGASDVDYGRVPSVWQRDLGGAGAAARRRL
jgi:uncharacterized protein YcaQ